MTRWTAVALLAVIATTAMLGIVAVPNVSLDHLGVRLLADKGAAQVYVRVAPDPHHRAVFVTGVLEVVRSETSPDTGEDLEIVNQVWERTSAWQLDGDRAPYSQPPVIWFKPGHGRLTVVVSVVDDQGKVCARTQTVKFL